MSRVVGGQDIDDKARSSKTSPPAAEFTEQQRAWIREIAAKIKQQRQDAKLPSPPKRSAT